MALSRPKIDARNFEALLMQCIENKKDGDTSECFSQAFYKEFCKERRICLRTVEGVAERVKATLSTSNPKR